MMKYKHLFGPVLSRRLGKSLGVDVVAYKYCSLNCVYCEVSRTTHLTLKRKSFFDIDEITSELDDYLKAKPELDYITFSGAGEPTLNSDLGEIISYIKSKYPQYKLALITNSTLFNDPQLLAEILPCDLIMPSLDAVSDEAFERVNRPVDTLTAQDIVDGLIKLRQAYTGQIWLEIFIVPGINDHLEEIELLKAAIEQIRPDVVQLNSLDRPGAEEWVEPAIYLAMEEIKAMLSEGNDIPIEIISRTYQKGLITEEESGCLQELTDLIKEDEYTKAELAKTMEIHVNEVSKLLQHLALQDRISVAHKNKGHFYRWKP
jgi:wyosine [tRNA(Phe)-imidazoG37] synthetase (radical SAM superfamily)